MYIYIGHKNNVQDLNDYRQDTHITGGYSQYRYCYIEVFKHYLLIIIEKYLNSASTVLTKAVLLLFLKTQPKVDYKRYLERYLRKS